MLENIFTTLKITVLVFIALTFLMNLRRLPRVPGDFVIDKLGFTIRIPFTSAIVISIFASILYKATGGNNF